MLVLPPDRRSSCAFDILPPPASRRPCNASRGASRESASMTGGLLARGIVNGLQSATRVEARRNEAIREAATARSSARGWRARFPLASYSLPLSRSGPLRALPPPDRTSSLSLLALPPDRPLSLYLSPFLTRRGSRLKTRSKSRRRVASSRFGDSKEGSFLFPSPAAAASALRSTAPTLFRVLPYDVVGATALVIRRARRPLRFRERSLLLWKTAKRLFGSHPRRPFSARPESLSRFFLSFLADLSGDRPFATFLARGLTKG